MTESQAWAMFAAAALGWPADTVLRGVKNAVFAADMMRAEYRKRFGVGSPSGQWKELLDAAAEAVSEWNTLGRKAVSMDGMVLLQNALDRLDAARKEG